MVKNAVKKKNGSGGAAVATTPGTATQYRLKLYVAGQSARSVAAISNLKRVCEEHLQGRYAIEVIDLLVTPQLAKGDQILALPTLVLQLPEPIKRIVGDLSNTERVLVGLDLKRD